MNKTVEKYRVQGKNGNFSGWATFSTCHCLKKAVQKAEQKFNQMRGKIGTEWYVTRVVDSAGLRVYPERCEQVKHERTHGDGE